MLLYTQKFIDIVIYNSNYIRDREIVHVAEGK
jgi:hypothetical protein